LNDHVLITGNRQLSATSGVAVPALIRDAGADTIRRFVEFFTANIRNPNTRSAYMRAVRRFCDWAESHKLLLSQIEPVIVAAYVEELQRQYSDLSVKQHLAALRMLFDYLVTGGILRVNPAAATSTITTSSLATWFSLGGLVNRKWNLLTDRIFHANPLINKVTM